MQTEVVEVSAVKRELKISYSEKEVSDAFKRSTRAVANQVEIKGFRRGKAPLSVVSGQYRGEIQRQVMQDLLEGGVDHGVKEHKVFPIGPVEPGSSPAAPLAEDKPFSLSVQFEVRPDIKLGEWKGLEVNKPKLQVGDAEVDAEIEKLRRRAAQLVPVLLRDTLEAEDFAVIDYQSTTLDIAEPVGKGTDAVVEMASKALLPGFSDKILGMKIGLDRAFDIAVPAENDNPQIAGKTVSFKVSLKGIKKLDLPALDDEFAKDVGAESLVALRDKLKAGLTNVQTMRIKNHLRDQLVDRMIEKHTFEVPQSLVAEQTKLMFSELVRRASMEGMDVSSLGREEVEGLTQQYWPKAERNVRFYLLVGEMAKAEKLEVSDAEIEAEIERLAELSQQEVSRVRAAYADRDRKENLRFQLLEDKVLTLLEQNAKLTDTDPLPEDKRQLL